MTWRRLLPLIALLALAVAPFGRMAAAEAMAPAHHTATAAPGHCDDMPAPDGDEADKLLDCLTACASLAAADASPLPVLTAAPASLQAQPPAGAAGVNPEADPPPPRLS